jgi:hypothetical protein
MENRFDLEEFVKNNADSFNNEEPEKGHFERFQAKLGQKSKVRPLIMQSMKYAAVFVFLITGFFAVRSFNWFEKPKYQAETGNQDEDFNEVMSFYNMQLEQKQDELNKLTCKNSDNQKTEVNRDLSELKNSFAELKSEFNANPNNQMIKNAIINNYQNQLDIYNLVIKNLQNYC